MNKFDYNDIGVPNGNYFGLPVNIESADVVLIPVPWDATVSYGRGTARGPEAIKEASLQVDLFDERIDKVWEMKVASLEAPLWIEYLNNKGAEISLKVIAALEKGANISTLSSLVEKVNTYSEKINSYVYDSAWQQLSQDRIIGVIGGEHSVPFGAIKACAKKYGEFGILHIDAHRDLRKAYEGFTYSHASIMYNVLEQIPEVKTITQVAVRDFCDFEQELANGHNSDNKFKNFNRIISFSDNQINKELFEGRNWRKVCEKIIDSLPEKVYISFDIDGLSPELCPNTGTPVPGGLSFMQIDYLFQMLRQSSKQIIGFDLCEVSPGENNWDANVGARILFMILTTIKSL
ncbi:MAG: agmatinase family protein [Bacteroidales bacterium]